jgi:hypothetical protein
MCCGTIFPSQKGSGSRVIGKWVEIVDEIVGAAAPTKYNRFSSWQRLKP